jgi:hypothetical protein
MSESPGEEYYATDKASDRQMPAMTVQDVQLSAIAKDTAGNCHTNFDGSGEKTDDTNNYNHLPYYLVGSSDQEAGRNGGGKDAKSSTKSDQNGPRRHHKHYHHHHHGSARKLTSKAADMQPEIKGHVRRHSHAIQHLGQTFKTQAHTR